ncbi:hypothetical protein NXU83_14215 [Bacteroides thetaiotaomicron]|uniref:hypothetical protein n=1 Tax=Bacteroides thetaiotaomicron TaxID=818 RepID=UPI00216674D0|nr:hypothetical protein [Bacteroides thetaiotaomicron]MCS3182679.1 hypothetical protein [Bacteroides thetaiotaomicron]
MKDYQQRINELRKEIVNSIINLLKEYELKELELDDDLDDLCYVVWFDNNGNAYDSPVRKVSLDKNGISLDVEDEYTGFAATLYCHDLGCQNLDWLCKLHENMLDTFEDELVNNE